MFNDLETQSLHQRIVESRLSEANAADVVLNHLMEQYEFGQGLFRKILNRSVLKPGSLETR